jgi:hypothetical protein
MAESGQEQPIAPAPPLERWAEDVALCELARLARDLPDVGPAEVWRRLGRLTLDQRTIVIATLAHATPGYRPGL